MANLNKKKKMTMDVIQQQQQNPLSSRLIVSVLSSSDSDPANSPDIIIKGMAAIRFRLRIMECKSYHEREIACSISSRKHSLSKDDIKMSVACNKMGYAQDSMCTENWSSWNEVGTKNFDSRCGDDIFHYVFEVDITLTVIGQNVFAKLYDDKEFTDFRLSSGQGSVAVHKACLASHSDMFKTLLANEWKNTDECRVEPAGVSLQTLQHLKAYLYVGSLPEQEVRQLLLLAKRYKFDKLQSECVWRLARKVTSADLFELLEFARENGIRELTLALIQLTPNEVVESVSQSLKQL